MSRQGGQGRKGGDSRTYYTFNVLNLGAVYARGVQLWLTNRGGTRVSTYMATGDLVLVPFEKAQGGTVQLQEELDLDELDYEELLA